MLNIHSSANDHLNPRINIAITRYLEKVPIDNPTLRDLVEQIIESSMKLEYCMSYYRFKCGEDSTYKYMNGKYTVYDEILLFIQDALTNEKSSTENRTINNFIMERFTDVN